MRKRLGLVMAALLLSVWAPPAAAIPFGVPDGNGHPYVGLIVFYGDQDMTQPLWLCTGTLISSTVVLTAGHCAGDPLTPPVKARVWFDAVPNLGAYPFSGGVTGTPVPHPGWIGRLTIPNTHDLGVVILEAAVAGPYGQLPGQGQLDALLKQRGLQEVTLKVVGYGLQGVRPQYLDVLARYVGYTRLVNLKSTLTDGYNIHLSNNPGHWSGGTCFGDSGGPIFLGNTIVAVNSFVLNWNCKGAGFGYRVDIPDARSFLDDYVPVP